MEVPAAQNVIPLVCLEDERVVGGGIDLRGQNAFYILQRITDWAMYLRCTAEGIGVLHPRRDGLRWRPPLVGEGHLPCRLSAALTTVRQATHYLGCLGLTGMGPRFLYAWIEGSQLPAHGLKTQGQGDFGVSQCQLRLMLGQYGDSQRHSAAVDQGQPFLGAQFELDGVDTGGTNGLTGRHASSVEERLCLRVSHQRSGYMS